MMMHRSRGADFLFRVCKLRGSVFPAASMVALPCAVITAALRYAIQAGHIGCFGAEDSVLKDNAAWAGFSFVVGFLIVFRASHSYQRFLEACTSTNQMRAEFFDACSALIAFCKHSKANRQLVSAFQNTVVRLCSMLHAAALGEIEDSSTKEVDSIAAFKFELIDVEGIDEDSLQVLKESDSKVELLFQWLQQLVVESIKTGVLSIPSPILSRSFQVMERGMMAFHEAMKISRVPYPFPYAQTCDLLLMLHWLVTPFVMSQWVSESIWAGIFSFTQIFILWALHFIAVELENPFGMAANDIDGHEMQLELNNQLLLLMRPSTQRIPKLNHNAFDLNAPETHSRRGYKALQQKSFNDAWQAISSGNETVVAHRFNKRSAFSGVESSTAHQPKFFKVEQGSVSDTYAGKVDLLPASPLGLRTVCVEQDASPERLEKVEEGRSLTVFSPGPKFISEEPDDDPQPLLLPRSGTVLSQAPHAFFAACRSETGQAQKVKLQLSEKQQDSPSPQRELTRMTSSDEIDGVSLQRENTRMASIEELDSYALQREFTRASSSDEDGSYFWQREETRAPSSDVQDGFPFLHREFMEAPSCDVKTNEFVTVSSSLSTNGHPCKL